MTNEVVGVGRHRIVKDDGCRPSWGVLELRLDVCSRLTGRACVGLPKFTDQDSETMQTAGIATDLLTGSEQMGRAKLDA